MIGPSCKDVAALVSQSLDTRLALRRRIGVRLHLLMCVYCRRYERELRWLRQALDRVRRDAAAGRLDESARKRIERELREEREDSP